MCTSSNVSAPNESRSMKSKVFVYGFAVVCGFSLAACHAQSAETATSSANSSANVDNTAAASSTVARPPRGAFTPFTPDTKPCALVAPDALSKQGAAPIKASDISTRETSIQECSYEESGYTTVLDIKLSNNPDAASNFRDFKVRVISSEGADIYVTVDEPSKCSATLLGPDSNIVQLEFTPTSAAVSEAALQAGQTWCDFSAPAIAEASKMLGWSK